MLLVVDVTAVISLADCMTSQSMSATLTNHSVLHLALSEVMCQRLQEETSFMIPMVGEGQSIVQLLADLRYGYKEGFDHQHIKTK